MHLLETRSLLPHIKELDQHQYPLFVTWQKNGDLRGCIGTFEQGAPFGE